MIYNMYIFNREGTCLYYTDWGRTNTPENLEEEFKLVYGMLFSLKRFIKMNSPSPTADGTFHFFLTNTYRFHYFESLTGLKFCVLSDPAVIDLKDTLKALYTAFVECVIKNPLYTLNEPVKCSLFIQRANHLIRSLPAFADRSNG